MAMWKGAEWRAGFLCLRDLKLRRTGIVGNEHLQESLHSLTPRQTGSNRLSPVYNVVGVVKNFFILLQTNL